MPHSKKNAPAERTAGACVVNTGNKFTSQNFDSTSRCVDANPRIRVDTKISSQKETPAAVRGKLGVEGWTVGDFAEVPEEMDSTSRHLGVVRAYVVHKNLLAERKTSTNAYPPFGQYRVDECLRVEVLA